MKATKTELKLFGKLQVFKEPETIKNPLSGEAVECPPEAVALYDFIIGSQMSGRPDWTEVEMALGLFRKNWPEQYMTLLD